MTVNATVFHHWITDAIANVPVTDPAQITEIFGTIPPGGTGSQRQNVDQAQVTGIEGKIEWLPVDAVTLGFTGLWSHTDFSKSPDQPLLDGKPFPQAPDLRLIASADWRATERWSLFAGCEYGASQYDDALASRSIPDFTTVRIGASWQIGARDLSNPDREPFRRGHPDRPEQRRHPHLRRSALAVDRRGVGFLNFAERTHSPVAFQLRSESPAMRMLIPILCSPRRIRLRPESQSGGTLRPILRRLPRREVRGRQGGSLVDGEWKHGSTDAEIFKSIAKGNLQLGMSPWEGVLTDDQIRALVIFLREKEKKTLAKGMDFPTPSPDKVTKTELESYRIETLVDKGLEKSVGDRLPAGRPQAGHREIRPAPIHHRRRQTRSRRDRRAFRKSSSTARAA